MTVTREARYLSGNDIGKAFTATDNETGERVSAKIDHLLTSKDWVQISYRVEGWWAHREGPMYRDITVNPQDPVTFTGVST
ncbi:hypothetical protein [Glutamicibacter sp. V16R2B1]|uniref:hypothetical protein n=1 Tax=Glutamicibacter sp. V16R2B1 TaxID=2036207 RepID=UPI0010FEAC89|nr:hypothetical protein [Glutamicibacter sp. V16R2B1]TLK56302.1 hypothetical protein FDN03_02295 [Glutamicibacter sp. V16R2B1]